MGVDVPQKKLDEALEDLNDSLRLLEEKFIQDRPFIAGDNCSLADLVAIVEVIQVGRKIFLFKIVHLNMPTSYERTGFEV